MSISISKSVASNLEESLKSAIISRKNLEIPGEWKVELQDDRLYLTWVCREEDAPEMFGDEAFSDWGGNEILKSADAPDFSDSGCDGYEKYGEQIICHWVQWKIDCE